MSGLHFDFTGNPSGLVNAANQSRIAIQGITDEADKAGMKIDEFLGASKNFVASMTGIGVGAAGIKYLGKRIVDVRSEFQNTEAMFKVFLKSGEAAESLMERMRSYAFNNVFDLSRLSQASAQLLAYGTDVDVVIDKLDNLSNIAAGTNKPLEELVGVYNKVKSTNIIDSRTELSLKNMGVNVREILEQSRQLEKGTLSGVTLNFKDLDDAIQAATHNGGMFEGMMEAKMETLGDKVGLLQDKIQNVFNDVGTEIQEPMGEVLENVADMLEDLKEPLTDVVKAGVEGAKFITEHWKEIAIILGTIAVQYGTVKAAMAMEKAYKNAQRLQMLREEAAELEELQKQYKKLYEEKLKNEVADLRNKSKGGNVDTKTLIELNQKERELIQLRSEIASAEIDNAMSVKDKYEYLNKAYEKYVDGLNYYATVSGSVTAQIIKNSEDEIHKTDEQLKKQLELDGVRDDEINYNFELIEDAKKRQKAAEDNIASITNETNALNNLIKARKEQGFDTDEEEARAKELSAKLQNEAQKHNDAVLDETNARTAINTKITESNTFSKEANAIATQSQAQTQKLANIQTEGANLKLKAQTVWMNVCTATSKVFKVAINSVKRSWEMLKLSMMTNPLGWIGAAIEGVVALGGWLVGLFHKEDKAAKQHQAMMDSIAKSEGQGRSEISNLNVLIKRIQAAGEGTEEYARLRLQLINQYGKYGDYVRNETDEIIKQGEAYEALKGHIMNAAKARGKAAYEQEIQNKLAEGYKGVYNELSKTRFIYGDISSGFFMKRVVDEETNEQLHAHIMKFMDEEMPKLVEAGMATDDATVTHAFERSFAEQYGKKLDLYMQGNGINQQDHLFANIANLYRGELGEIQKQLASDWWNVGETSGTKEGTKRTMEDVKKAYLSDVNTMMQAQKLFAENASEENKQAYESAKQTAENTLKEYKMILGETDPTLTLKTAADEEVELKKKIEDAARTMADARDGIVDGEKVSAEFAREMYNKTKAQLTLDNERLKVVQKTTEELKKSPYYTLRMELSVDDIADKYTQNQKRLDEIAKELKIKPTVELNIEQEQLQNEQKELEHAFKSRSGITDQAWQEYKARKAALSEEEKIRDSQLKSDREKIAATKKQALEQLKLSNEEYKRNNMGKIDPAYALKKKNILLKAELDTKELERKYNEWKRDFERQTLQITIDMKIDALQHRINTETDITKQIELQNELYERQKELKKADIRLERDQKIEKEFGEEAKSEYFKWIESDKSTEGYTEAQLSNFKQIDEIFSEYNNRIQTTMMQMAQDKMFQDIDAEVNRLQSYYDEVARINKEYNDKIYKFEQEGATDAERARAEELKKQQLKQVKRLLGSTDASGLTDRFLTFGNDIANLTFEEIIDVYTKFMNDLNADITSLDKEIEQLRNTDAHEYVVNRLGEVNAQLENEDLTEEERVALLKEKDTLEAAAIDKKQAENYLSGVIADKEKQSLTLKKGQVKAEKEFTDALQNAETKEERSEKIINKQLEVSVQSLQLVKDAAEQVADVFGGALSNKGKKALETISQIAEFGISSITSIGTVFTSTNMAILNSVAAGVSGLEALQAATVILQIISMAVMAVMGIVKIVEKFTGEAKMQDRIDEDIERVEALKREQEALNKAFEREAGTAYYKGMSKAAKNYYNLIKAQEKTVADSRALYERQANKYGEDSDKAKDAKKQYDEQLDALEDFKKEQKEMFDEMAQDLLTTDLSSFTENLADQYIEGFEKGMDGINGVLDDVLNDTQKQMMKKGLQIALENLFKSTWDNMKKMTEDGDLTTSEMDAIMAEMDAKAAQSKQIAEQYYNAMSERGLLGDGDVETSSGGFDAMTQDQADTLSARFTALQIEGANVVTAMQAMMTIMEQLGVNDAVKTSTLNQMMTQFTLANEIALNQLDELRKITENTSTLADTNRRLRAIEDNTNSLRE